LPNEYKKIGELASRSERTGRKRTLGRPVLSVIKESSAPGRRRYMIYLML
jgi:hypothetical protein